MSAGSWEAAGATRLIALGDLADALRAPLGAFLIAFVRRGGHTTQTLANGCSL
jgi:hypothetical protein